MIRRRRNEKSSCSVLERYREYRSHGICCCGRGHAGAEVDIMTSAAFSADKIKDYGSIAFGCPSMGDEVLEEVEFEPMFTECESKLGGKEIALFGSYGWGNGEWMTSWEERCENDNANLVCESVIVNETPDEKGLERCRALGKALV